MLFKYYSHLYKRLFNTQPQEEKMDEFVATMDILINNRGHSEDTAIQEEKKIEEKQEEMRDPENRQKDHPLEIREERNTLEIKQEEKPLDMYKRDDLLSQLMRADSCNKKREKGKENNHTNKQNCAPNKPKEVTSNPEDIVPTNPEISITDLDDIYPRISRINIEENTNHHNLELISTDDIQNNKKSKLPLNELKESKNLNELKEPNNLNELKESNNLNESEEPKELETIPISKNEYTILLESLNNYRAIIKKQSIIIKEYDNSLELLSAKNSTEKVSTLKSILKDKNKQIEKLQKELDLYAEREERLRKHLNAMKKDMIKLNDMVLNK